MCSVLIITDKNTEKLGMWSCEVKKKSACVNTWRVWEKTFKAYAVGPILKNPIQHVDFGLYHILDLHSHNIYFILKRNWLLFLYNVFLQHKGQLRMTGVT